MSRLKRTLRELARYPSAVVGLAIIFGLIAISLYAVITIPYSEAIRLWRGGPDVWYDSPKNAQPVWTNLFAGSKQPSTVVMSSQDEVAAKNRQTLTEDMIDISFAFTLDYPYDGFPQEMSLFFTSEFAEKVPFVTLTWLTPDGREIDMGDFSIDQQYAYRASQDDRLKRRLDDQLPHIALFADPNSDPEDPVALPGTYTLQVNTLVFEDDADVDAEFVVFGQVHGLAGTDHRRRDLMVALLWGTPIALAFGLLAAVGTSIATMIIAGVGVWYGGWVDGLIQRITEVNLILPLLPILIMIGTFYSKSLWVMLGVIIVLFIFGGTIKTYRAVFLQVREAPYIEAAQAYGASNVRLIFRYLIPRIIPLLIPAFVVIIPTFVFLEASLAVLGLGDPILPTWGKIIRDANSNGALYSGFYYWVLQPAALLMVTGFAFAMVGFSLDRIFNPRLRGL